MKTLDDAWKWFESTRLQLRRIQRLAEHYWDDLPWEKRLERDDHFRLLQSATVQGETRFSLAFLR